jgi:hypothetical protein
MSYLMNSKAHEPCRFTLHDQVEHPTFGRGSVIGAPTKAFHPHMADGTDPSGWYVPVWWDRPGSINGWVKDGFLTLLPKEERDQATL